MTFNIVKSELPGLKLQLEELTSTELSQGIFIKEELETAEASQYYNHVDFGMLK